MVCLLNLTSATDQKGSAGWKKSPDHPAAGWLAGIKANRLVVIGQSVAGKGAL